MNAGDGTTTADAPTPRNPTAGGRLILVGFFCLVVALWVFRNLPWTLEEYDEAKQAYASLFAVRENAWLVQELPSGDPATKPPLMAWLSAGLHLAGVPLELAWRIPSLFAAVGLLAGVMFAAFRMGGRTAMWFAGIAFSFSILTLRIATLVRTDMLLALFCFGAAAIILRAITNERRLFPGEMMALLLVFAAANFTKGPVLGAFVLPELLIALVLGRGMSRGDSLRVLAIFVVALLPFVWWSLEAARMVEGFQERIVGKEFLSRFESGEEAAHRSQPVLFYVAQLIRGWGPWFPLLLVLATIPTVRREAGARPAWFMLALMTVCGLVVMSAIPSKRLDRIYPLVPLMALLFGLFASAIPAGGWAKVLRAVCALGVLGVGGYGVWESVNRARDGVGDLAAFSANVLHLSRLEGSDPILERTTEESLACYLRVTRPLKAEEIVKAVQGVGGGRFVIAEKTLNLLREQAGEGNWEIVESVEVKGKKPRRFVHVRRISGH